VADLHPGTPDSFALRRRVLLTAVLTLGAFFVLGYTITALEAPPWLLLPAMLLVVVLVVRPLMAPVVAANRLQRRLAMQAFLEQQEDGRG
jgi:hypothetical protein